MSESGREPAGRPPLAGIRVLDFSTLLPGPLASLLLAEAGAEVIKVERPGVGDELRVYPPPAGGWGFALLNRGKKSVALDLKAGDAEGVLHPLIGEADVVIEQFRPGVMERLGLGYEAMRAINPALVYCSISGYGQAGERASEAGHDLNYQARCGLLSLGGDAKGQAVIAPGLIADIGGGSLPAVINILLALRQAEQSGEGRHLDISMTDNLFCWSWWAQAALAGGSKPEGGGRDLLAGGSPRYRVYRTADGRYLAVAALEPRFWNLFCDLIDLPQACRAREVEAPAEVIDAVAEILASKALQHWISVFAGRDVCVTPVASLEEALADPAFQARGLFAARLRWEGRDTTALPLPLDPGLRVAAASAEAPALGSFIGKGFGTGKGVGKTGAGEPLPAPGDTDRMPPDFPPEADSAAESNGQNDDDKKHD